MNLNKKKELAARALKVGKERIFFFPSRLSEIKEAMTKQDIRDLHKENAIIVKSIKGRKRKPSKKRKKGDGNKRKPMKDKKKTYMALTRKLRKELNTSKKAGKISKEDSKEIRKKIRNKQYRSKAHFKMQEGELKR